ncbi:MAG: class I SAM-dependent methyltransferase [Rhodocyclaceae bacterium]|nr:MAG: class I SAM-dependent methyltransferase [Rhodocyclaceae bacterium]
MNKPCAICDADMDRVFSATVLSRHEVNYYRCAKCGLVQTEDPYWLDEAYRDPIAASDTGLIQRNFSLAAKLASLLYFCLERKGAYLDVTGGYGMLVRLMRDIGFDFYWSDKHCENILARGFESAKAGREFSALTAFEVLEHVQDPLGFVSALSKEHGVRTLIFSTQTYAGDLPPKDWWYYAFETGQHITFYQARTLATLAGRLGLHFLSANGLHVLTDRPARFGRLKLLTGLLAFPAAVCIRRRLGSKTMSDHLDLMRAAEY